jgi:hypothetical protein
VYPDSIPTIVALRAPGVKKHRALDQQPAAEQFVKVAGAFGHIGARIDHEH